MKGNSVAVSVNLGETGTVRITGHGLHATDVIQRRSRHPQAHA